MAGQNLIKARRRLTELFKTGVEIRMGGRYGKAGEIAAKGEGPFLKDNGKPDPLDEQAGEFAMWVQPPSPLQRDMALRDANAARARAVLAIKRDTDSEDHLVAAEFVQQMSEETLYDYILVGGIEQRRQEAIREVLADEEWKDITELQDSLRVFAEEERADDDPEVLAVRERELALSEAVTEREKELREAEMSVLKLRGIGKARQDAIEKRGELVASRAFMAEYERQMTYFAVRDIEDHKTLFFTSAREMSEQSDEVLELIQRALEPFIQDGAEAKNSQRVVSGSESSELPSTPETSAPSTPEESSE